jgi:hypothetical protein
LLAGKEGVAFAAHLDFEHFLGGADGKSIATGTNHFGISIIFWVNFIFQFPQPGKR